MTISIPLCYYPMQKIMLDDDKAFSQSILLKMHGKKIIAYDSPRKALDYLLNEYQPSLTKSDLVAIDFSINNPSTQCTININIEKLKKMLVQENHSDISVLLVDYHMPEMCGLDFLRQIQHLPIRKALITAEKDSQIGLDAYREGLVDAYVRKGSPNFITDIENIVSELEWKYFSELSSVVSAIPEFDYLKNSNLLSVFKHFIKENNIISYCLTDVEGCFLAKNKNEQIHFVVRNKTQLQKLAKVAKEDGATEEVILNLEQGKVIPYFGNKEYWQVPASEWNQYLYPSNFILGDSNVAWAAVK